MLASKTRERSHILVASQVLAEYSLTFFLILEMNLTYHDVMYASAIVMAALLSM